MIEDQILPTLSIYKASAGSGKTFTLAATYIAHLLADDDDFPHKHQLAVTFTNKATAEMKERIIQYLYSIATGNDDNDGFFKSVRALVPERITNKMLRYRAKRSLLCIIHDYDHFHVTTIDSFFQSLLSSLAHDLNLSSNFKVEISDKEVIAKAVDRLLNNLKENDKELAWLTHYIQERISDDKSWNVAEELKSLASQLTKEPYMLYSGVLNKADNPHVPNAINLDNQTTREYKATLNKLAREQRLSLAELAGEANTAIEAGIGYERIANGQRIVKGFLEKTANQDIAYRDLKEPSATLRAYADGTKDMVKKADLKKRPELAGEAEAVRPYLAALIARYDESMGIINSCQLSLANLNPLRLLNAIDQEVKALNRENDRMLLASTPLLFHNLSNDTDASFVFERAGTQYRHVMIDEFQDTSKLQWDNIRKLLVENMAQGNTCMLVGDVKQGIYRWRGGDWNALANFTDGYNPDLHSYINIDTLKRNFRSGKAVVEFNNRLFTAAPAVVMDCIREIWGPDESDSTPDDSLNIERIYPTPGEEDNHEVTQLTHAEGGFVRVELINEDDDSTSSSTEEDKEEYSREASVAEQMIRLHQIGVPYNKMAILIRGSNDATPLMKYFGTHHDPQSEHPIALMSEEAFLLESSPAVMTIINALRYVSNPTDQIALAYLREQCPEKVEFDDILSILDDWSKARHEGLPFYETVCRLAGMFHLHDQQGQSPYLYYFLDAVLMYIDDQTADVKAFLQHWDETLHRKAIPSAAVDGVRILTIHKSKGLAFHSVFIPYCDWKIDTHPELIWTLPSCAPYNKIPFLPVRMTKEAGKSIYRDIFKRETFDKYIENLNLLYVAFTRTQQNLLVWADCSINGIAPILRDSLGPHDSITEWGEPSALYITSPSNTGEDLGRAPQKTIPAIRLGDQKQPKSEMPLEYKTTPVFIDFTYHDPKLIFRQSNNAELFLHPNAEEEEAIREAVDAESEEKKAQQEIYRKTGILLHNLMSVIEKQEDIEIQIEEVARNGQLPPTLSKDSVCKLIKRRLSHPTARHWFDGSWQLYRECSLVFLEKDEAGRQHTVVRRPDRVMMRGNTTDGTDETIVIDFKFGKFKAEHREQVKEYMDLISQQGRHHVKGYLWYLYTGSIEEVL